MNAVNATSNPSLQTDHVFAELVEELAAKLEAGEPVALDVYVGRYPEYADQLGRLLPAMQAMAALGSSCSPRQRAANTTHDERGDPVGGTLGDFRIIREVGRGGMGIVYEAEQLSLGRRVALKVLPFAGLLDPKQLHRFKNEAFAAAQLHHQNIVPVYSVGCERSVHFYAMQFIEGQTLAELIHDLREAVKKTEDRGSRIEDRAMAQRSVLPPSSILDPQSSTRPVAALSTERSMRPREFFRTVAQLGIQAAEALDHAHQLGIIHRDIKPSNLLLDQRGNLWITDFGLARIHCSAHPDGDGRGGHDLTMTGDIIGTLRYMSPEQALAKRVVVDHRTDVYSLGVTLYELLTLRPAFAGHDRQEILRMMAFDDPHPPRKINSAIPAELETIVLKALAKNPAERYATAQELADDLRRHLADKAILARRPGPVRRLVKWSMRHKALVWSTFAATAAAIVVFAIAAGWIMSDREWRQNETEREVTRAIEAAEQFMSSTNWLEAKTSLSRADGLLVTGRANDELRERVRQLYTDLQMIARLEQIREDDVAMLDGLHDYAALDQRYETAFRDYGIDALGGWWSSLRDPSALNPAAELGARRLDPSHPHADLIARRPIRHELAAALDHWAVIRRRATGVTDSRIVAIARAVDPDELRNRVRDALERNDLDALLSASSSDEIATLSPASAILWASALAEAGSPEPAVAVLESVQHANPGDLWLNLVLTQHLHKLARWDEMRRFADIAHALRPTSGAARLAFADALRHKGSLDQSAALCDEVIRLKPDNPHAYELLGSIREDQSEWADAVTQYRRAIELDPAYVEAYNHLGRCLTRNGEIDAAIDALRTAIELKPQYGGAHENLGVALARKGRIDEAIDELHKAIALDPQSAQPHTDLGVILVNQGQVAAAIDEYRQAIELNPNWAEAHNNLAIALLSSNDVESAVTEFRNAIELKPHFAGAHWNLAQTLIDQGNFAEALVHLRHGYETSLRDRYGPYPWADRLRECERLLELDSKLPAVLAGTEAVADAAERAEYGALCYSKRLYTTAARFYEQAFADQPNSASDLTHGHRYSAACSAILAAAGPNEDTAPPNSEPNDAERARQRRQALDWLRADLNQHATNLKSLDSKQRQQVTRQLQHWQVDRDLTSVREAESLAKLPEAEQEPWRELWTEVAEVLQRGNRE